MEKIYTVAEARDYLRISDATIRRYIKDGRLEAQRVNRQYRIAESSIKDFLNAQGKLRK
jgi:excisionase family DNA binding protein